MQITPSNLQFIFFQADMRFQSSYLQTVSYADKVSSEMPSSARETHYGWLGRIPKMRQWLSERVINDLAAREYTLKNVPYEDTVRISKFDIEDDQLGVFNQGVEMLGLAAKQWRDDMLTQVIVAATGSTQLCYDGQPFFSGSHPQNPDVPGGTTFSNRFDGTTTGALALNATNYASVRSTMMSYTGEDGLPLGIIPTHLMVPPSLGVTARTILNAETIAVPVNSGSGVSPGGAAQQTNVLKGTADVIENPFLTNQNAWYVLCCAFPVRPFVIQIRQAPKFTYLVNPNDPNVFNTHDFVYGVDARGAAGVTLPFLAIMASS
jgi:phage major head subunit gpT-like protein